VISVDQTGCFQILRKNKVRFYDPTSQWKGGSPTYGDDDEDDVDEEDQLETAEENDDILF